MPMNDAMPMGNTFFRIDGGGHDFPRGATIRTRMKRLKTRAKKCNDARGGLPQRMITPIARRRSILITRQKLNKDGRRPRFDRDRSHEHRGTSYCE